MADAEPWTILRLLTWTTDFLKGKGVEQPRLEAEVLLAEARGCKRIELYTSFADVPADDVRTKFRELVKKRAEGAPVAYLVGRKEFFSLSLRVTGDVLIPRPETEHLVIEALDLLKTIDANDRPPAIADVGTGSGAIAVALAKHAPEAKLTAIDISQAALDVAMGNAAEHEVTERIDFKQGDLLNDFPPSPAFDLIVSNPPYVSSEEMRELAAEVRSFEPKLALEAGPRGTEIIARLIPQAAERLIPKGWLLVEISPMIETAVHELFAADGRYEPAVTAKDLAGRARVVKGRRLAP